MGLIAVGGTGGRKAIAEYLRSGIPGIDVIDGNDPAAVAAPDFKVLLLDVPLEELGAPRKADLVLIEWGPAFKDQSEVGLEKAVKEATGAGKVLIYSDETGRKRAFSKALDLVRCIAGGGRDAGRDTGKSDRGGKEGSGGRPDNVCPGATARG